MTSINTKHRKPEASEAIGIRKKISIVLQLIWILCACS